MSSSKSSALSTKPRASRTKNTNKDEALAAVKKGPIARLNANIDAAKYKRLKLAALQNNTDITTLLDGWIDTYLAG